MMLRTVFTGFALAGMLAAQNFIQMSDPQFGMFTKDKGFEHETVNFEFAIASANRLKPAFVVITGDLINQAGNAAQTAEYLRIAKKLDPSIKLFQMPGNHDVGNEPTKESLATYRQRFGQDYYSFRVGDIAGFVLNSSLEKEPKNVPEEAARMESWFKAELAKARTAGAKHLIVFQHHPFFLKEADEPDQYFNIPRETRRRYLAMMHESGVKSIIAGHYHRNAEGRDSEIEMITTGPVGMPLEKAKSGIRIVLATDAGITHRYYEFGELPETLAPEAK